MPNVLDVSWIERGPGRWAVTVSEKDLAEPVVGVQVFLLAADGLSADKFGLGGAYGITWLGGRHGSKDGRLVEIVGTIDAWKGERAHQADGIIASFELCGTWDGNGDPLRPYVFDSGRPGERSFSMWGGTAAGQGIVPEFLIRHSADITGDGSVDLADFQAMVGNFGKTTAGLLAGFNLVGDLNGDGIVDILDFAILAGRFGKKP